MKKCLLVILVTLTALSVSAEPIRVAVMDFENQTGQASDALLGGTINTDALTSKGVNILTRRLVNKDGFVLIDRRDYIRQVEALHPTDDGKATPIKPTFIQAAQQLNADALLRGNLESFSTGKRVVNQGGYKTEMSTVSLRVSIEALDPVDGSVIAMASGTGKGNFRQTAESYTEMSEDDAIQLMEQAINQALPKVQNALTERKKELAARPKIKMNIKTTADPALIEIDGVLVGTSPVEGLEVYKGDHVLTVGKQGYRDITKRILFDHDVAIEVPMMRTELSAEETKEILEKSRLSVISTDGIQPALIINDM